MSEFTLLKVRRSRLEGDVRLNGAKNSALRLLAASLLTAEPGPDVAPYHTRGVLPLPPAAWPDWLFGRRPTAELLSPPPAGTLTAVAAPRGG